MSSWKDGVNDLNTVPAVLEYWASILPDREAFVFFNENGRTGVLTASDVYTLACKFATRLRGMGFKPGDVISNAIPNSPERVVTDFGIMFAGCIGSNCQIMLRDGSDFWNVARRCGTKCILVANQTGNPEYTILKDFVISPPKTNNQLLSVVIPDAPSIKSLLQVDRCGGGDKDAQPSFLESLRQESDQSVSFVPEEVSSLSTTYVFATSGTTGYCKLSPRSHEVILRTARHYETGDPSVRFNRRPLGWVGGFPFSFLSNCTTFVNQDGFAGNEEISAGKVWEVIESEGCVKGFMLPHELDFFVRHFKDSPPCYKLKCVITGGQPLTKKVCESLGVITDALIVSYASTEMGAMTNGFVTRADQMKEFFVGTPMSGVTIRVVSDAMEDTKPEERGLILVKSPHGSNVYFDQTPQEHSNTYDGYFITGDVGWLDERGQLYVSDRSDDVIHYGSILIYPSWPESIISRIPGVSEVVVMGIDSNNNSERSVLLHASVVVKAGYNLTPESILVSYDDYFIANKDEFRPRLSFVKLLDQLPTGSSGKPDRKKLRLIAQSDILSNT